MNPQKSFLISKIRERALQFGDFVLKSGKKSSYFIDFGRLNDAESFSYIGQLLAREIVDSGLDFQVLFGPAYKGIPIAVTTSVALYDSYRINKSIAFSRKEPKDHGEGGLIIGDVDKKDIILVDDVLSYGTAIRDVLHLLEALDVNIKACFVLLDREELNEKNQKISEQIAEDIGIPVYSVLKLSEISSELP